jgi:hypothetical protein
MAEYFIEQQMFAMLDHDMGDCGPHCSYCEHPPKRKRVPRRTRAADDFEATRSKPKHAKGTA